MNSLPTHSNNEFEKVKQGKLQVIVRDNAIGIDEELMQNSNSFGCKMVCSLSRKLKADINVKNDQGTTVQMYLSRYKLVV